MNAAEISTAMDAIGAAILEKTGEKPWFAPRLAIYDNLCHIELMRAYVHSGHSRYVIGTAKGDTPEDAIAHAWRIIASLPDLDSDNLLAAPQVPA